LSIDLRARAVVVDEFLKDVSLMFHQIKSTPIPGKGQVMGMKEENGEEEEAQRSIPLNQAEWKRNYPLDVFVDSEI
jgi:hypothetical protein